MMSGWKLQCHFCKDTVSTGKLNRQYYRLHLEAVHNINENCERLLGWALAQQNLDDGGGGPAATISSVANIMKMKGITIERSKDSSGSSVPGSLINIKGITVQKVSEGGPPPSAGLSMRGGPAGRGIPPGGRGGIIQNPQQNAAIMRQQEQAINRWANGCEHGCRLCKREGKHFISFARQGLIKHLETEHSISERDYREEFKVQNLITRTSNMSCKECGHKVKRLPHSLNQHFKKHNMNLRQYWLKHLKPPHMAMAPMMNGMAGRGGGAVPVMRGGRGGWGRGAGRGGGAAPLNSGSLRCTMKGCERAFDNHQALSLHMAWHRKGGGAQRGGLHAARAVQPKVMLSRVDQATINREQAGLGNDDAMEVELDPLTLLEMGMGEDNIEIEGEAVKEEPPDIAEEEERDLHTPCPDEEEVASANGETGEEDGSEAQEQEEEDEEEKVEAGRTVLDKVEEKKSPDHENDDIEVVYNITGQKANPNIPIPLPDMRDQPPGSHVPPASPATTDKPVADNAVGGIKTEAEIVENGGGSGSKPSEKTDDKEGNKELNKHSIGHILDSGESEPTAPPEESPTKSTKEPSGHQVALPPAAAAASDKPTQAPAGNTGVAFQPLASPASFQPPQSYQQGNNYAGFPASAGGSVNHHTQQQPPPPNMYYPPQQQPYHPPYTTGYETGTSYPTFQSTVAPMGAGGLPYPPYPPPPPSAAIVGVPKTNWAALSCPYSIAQCPLYCCHVRAMQELEEGATDWARPYGPPASGFGDPCLCCINT